MPKLASHQLSFDYKNISSWKIMQIDSWHLMATYGSDFNRVPFQRWVGHLSGALEMCFGVPESPSFIS